MVLAYYETSVTPLAFHKCLVAHHIAKLVSEKTEQYTNENKEAFSL